MGEGRHNPVVRSCNEWDPLEEVIVGNPLRARFPTADPSTRLAEYPGRNLDELPQGAFPQWIIEETEEDLQAFIAVLENLGITVQRPETWQHDATFSTIHWQSWGFYNYCPRDLMLDYLAAGARWYSAPRPMLLDTLFDVNDATPRNDEPAFDAANVLRLGRDLIYLVSGTGNELGGQWLQTILGEEFRVHFLKDVYYGSHIDSTFVALRPGLMLCNPERLSDNTLPDILSQWDVIYSPPMEAQDRYSADYLAKSIGSEWIDMNLFSITPDLVVVDRDQSALIRLLEKQGLDVIPLKLRHARMLGGGFHCVTLDIRRRGGLQSYFD